MPSPTSDAIEIWRSVTGIDDANFSLLTTLLDGASFSFDDSPVVPQQIYIYRARRYQANVALYSAWSPLVYVRGPWPLRTGNIMANETYTGMDSLLGIAREATEGIPCKAQKGYDRLSGSMDIDLDNPDRETLQNIDTDIESAPGVSKVGPESILSTWTPEGLSRALCALFGDPTETVGGGTAPAATAATASAAGGVIPATQQVYFKTAYVRPTDWGVTTASTEFSATTSAGVTNSISVASPAVQTGATGWNLYASLASGAETLVASNIAIGTPYVLTDLAKIDVSADVAPQSFFVHQWKSKRGFVPHTLLEKRGNSVYAFPGSKVNSHSFSVDKTQSTPLQATFEWLALNQLIYRTDGVLTDVALDTAGMDPNACFGSSQAIMTIAGNLAPQCKVFNIKLDKAMQERQGLTGYRGPVAHFSEGCTYTGDMTMYFGNEAESIVYFGKLDSVTVPYGATKRIRTFSMQLAIIGEPTTTGYRPRLYYKVPKAQYKKVAKPVQGKNAIMQSVNWKAYYDAASSCAVIIELWHSEALATITAAATPITSVPINAINAYTA
ncbi:MAG: hypothetical protein ABIY70_20300 [Capsulimonas sp.]|uniref:hypothetical protein n=1 Tax=Capsulimonas sp. TaxID=2494211 RepID=UPI003264CB0B